MNNNCLFSIRFVFFFLIYAMLGMNATAQTLRKGQVEGKILDAGSSFPLGFATVSIYEVQKMELVNGNITNEKGVFSIELPAGVYYARIEFMGYEAFQTDPFEMPGNNSRLDLGTIEIKPATEN